MIYEAKDILVATRKLNDIAEQLTDLFYEQRVFTRREVDSALYNTILDVQAVENRLLLMFAQGYARMEQINE